MVNAENGVDNDGVKNNDGYKESDAQYLKERWLVIEAMNFGVYFLCLC